jgi:hypothetical protein
MTFSLHRTKKSLQCNILKGGAIMRALGRLVAVAAILLFVLGLKAVVPTMEADASVGQNPTMNVLQMQLDYVNYLHVLNVHDMTFALD